MVARGPVEFFVDDFAPGCIVCLHGPSWSHVAPFEFLVVVGVVFVSIPLLTERFFFRST